MRPLPTKAEYRKRFWSKVNKSGDCWVWTDALDGGGYGGIQIGGRNGKRVSAHRYAYEDLVGSIPEGLDLDHLCRNRACVNPKHLEPVTRRVNLLRGVGIPARNAKATVCSRGHEFTETNTYFYEYNGNMRRQCRECNNLQKYRKYHKDKDGS